MTPGLPFALTPGLPLVLTPGLPLGLLSGFPLARTLVIPFALVASPKLGLRHTLPKMGLGSLSGLPKTQSAIAGAKTPCIEAFFIPLKRS